ncbi:MAG: NAD(P)H-dependent oxidoreductase subunit E, partial [Dehalococcoidia bacterium]
MPRVQNPEDLASLRQELKEEQGKYQHTIAMCAGTACQACDCLPVAKAMETELDKQGLTDEVRFYTTGCHGFCEQAPLLIIEPGDTFYCHVQEDDVEEILTRTLKGGEIIDRLLYTDPVSGKLLQRASEIPFYAGQDRLLLSSNPRISPTDIREYVAIGGYSALAKTLMRMAPQNVIDEVKASGLRGCGGGGYPTGRKWEQCRAAPGDEHYVICNADEGDPGAYMDRSLLEGNPHSVLEGMMIGAFAIGAGRGFVYVRREYPLAVVHIQRAVEQAREFGLLGEGILGSDFSFDVKVVR